MQYGNLDTISSEQMVVVIAAKLSSLVQDKSETVVLAGTVGEEISYKIYELLKEKVEVKLEYAGNPLLNAFAVEKISAANHVLVVERVHNSRRSEVESQMEMLSVLKKDVLGIIFV